MPKKEKITKDTSTEEKIMEAARKVFTQKGYAGTRTRDIAEEAGINLALLNYYFRSKEKLFMQVMQEKFQLLFGLLLPIIENPSTTLETKIDTIVSTYIDTITENPDLPVFVLSELRGDAKHIQNIVPLRKIEQKSSLFKQLHERRPDLNPLHFTLNILSLTIFPFMVGPVFEKSGVLDKSSLEKLLQERKKLIPVWIKTMLETT